MPDSEIRSSEACNTRSRLRRPASVLPGPRRNEGAATRAGHCEKAVAACSGSCCFLGSIG
jgi:3,4-dihydroxy-2-butanone 4-phosphate synthase